MAKVEQMLRDAHDALFAFAGFRPGHRTKSWSINQLERLDDKGTVHILRPKRSERS